MVSPSVRSHFFTALALACLLPGAASACEFGYCWGAIATGPNSITGYATRLPTAPAASERAQRACGDKCDVIEVFHDSCAAIGETYERDVYLGFGDTRNNASDMATGLCRDAGYTCVVRVWACSQ